SHHGQKFHSALLYLLGGILQDIEEIRDRLRVFPLVQEGACLATHGLLRVPEQLTDGSHVEREWQACESCERCFAYGARYISQQTHVCVSHLLGMEGREESDHG